MEETNHKTAEAPARPTNYFGWAAALLLLFPVLAMSYVSVALLYSPIRIEAAIFAALPISPLLIRMEWYAATVIGLYAVFSVRKGRLPGVAAAILLAAGYVHLHSVLLGNISIPAWLTVIAAALAMTGLLVEKRRNES